LSFINTNGKTVKALYLLGIKYLETISIITHKVFKFVAMIEQNNENKLIEGEDYYLTPEGYKVFTEKYHLKRGYCCRSGCRHCPYGFDKKTGTIRPKK